MTWADEALRRIGEWAKGGSLKSLTIYLPPGLRKFLEGIRIDLLRPRGDLLRNCIKLLHTASAGDKGTRGYFAQLKRKIVLETEWETFSRSYQQTGIWEETSCTPEQAMGLLNVMHVAFRGEFWVDRTLCFKDGEKMCKDPLQVRSVDDRLGTDNEAIARRSEQFSMIHG